nr:hypothetical protein [Desulfobacterales bacterium]
MKQYIIDELRPGDYKKIKEYLDRNYGIPILDGVYRIPLHEHDLNEIQLVHKDCQPFYFAVTLERTLVSFEFLIRSQHRLRCECVGYANEKQRTSIIEFADSIFEELDIIT